MDASFEFDKLLELSFHGSTYLMRVKNTSNQLLLELEDKSNGDLWMSQFKPQEIEDITHRTGNHKKYSIFVKMLLSALQEQSESVCADILTYHDLEMLKTRKTQNQQNSRQNRSINPQLLQKRYLILTYLAEFDKVHYPLHLNYVQEPSVERMKATIRRLSQQLKNSGINQNGEQSLIKEISVLRHQNELLKMKSNMNNPQFSQSRFERKENHSEAHEMKMKEKDSEIFSLKEQIVELTKINQISLNKKLDLEKEKEQLLNQLSEKNELICLLRQKMSHQNDVSSNGRFNSNMQIEQKIEEMENEMIQLSKGLQHAKQKEKKDQLRILNLQKQLDKMIQLKQKQRFPNFASQSQMINKRSINNMNQSQKSDLSDCSSEKGSKKSFKKSNRSKSIESLRKSLTKKSVKDQPYKKMLPRKKSSVYDSDTESSRMRRQTNSRASPFRQITAPSPKNSARKGAPTRNNPGTIGNSSFNQRSSRDLKHPSSRERVNSKQKSISGKKIEVSPPSQSHQNEETILMSETNNEYDSDTDGCADKIQAVMANLRKRKANKMMRENNNSSNVQNVQRSMGKSGKKIKNENSIEMKISSIAEMLRKSKNQLD